jgi:hypothetical protein
MKDKISEQLQGLKDLIGENFAIEFLQFFVKKLEKEKMGVDKIREVILTHLSNKNPDKISLLEPLLASEKNDLSAIKTTINSAIMNKVQAIKDSLTTLQKLEKSDLDIEKIKNFQKNLPDFTQLIIDHEDLENLYQQVIASNGILENIHNKTEVVEDDNKEEKMESRAEEKDVYVKATKFHEGNNTEEVEDSYEKIIIETDEDEDSSEEEEDEEEEESRTKEEDVYVKETKFHDNKNTSKSMSINQFIENELYNEIFFSNEAFPKTSFKQLLSERLKTAKNFSHVCFQITEVLQRGSEDIKSYKNDLSSFVKKNGDEILNAKSVDNLVIKRMIELFELCVIDQELSSVLTSREYLDIFKKLVEKGLVQQVKLCKFAEVKYYLEREVNIKDKSLISKLLKSSIDNRDNEKILEVYELLLEKEFDATDSDSETYRSLVYKQLIQYIQLANPSKVKVYLEKLGDIKLIKNDKVEVFNLLLHCIETNDVNISDVIDVRDLLLGQGFVLDEETEGVLNGVISEFY